MGAGRPLLESDRLQRKDLFPAAVRVDCRFYSKVSVYSL